MKCKHCAKMIINKGTTHWFDDSKIAPQYCWIDPVNGSQLHEPDWNTQKDEILNKNGDNRYVLLRGLEQGNEFFTGVSVGDTEDSLVRLYDGTIAYEIIGFAPTIREAQIKLYGYSSTTRDD